MSAMPPERTAPDPTTHEPTTAASPDPSAPATDIVPVTIPHPQVAAASDALAAVLVGEPDLEVALHVAEAIDVLADVLPPLPPLAYPEVGTDADEGITRALVHLRAAVEAARPDEALRAGRAAALLRQAQGPRDEHGLLPSVLT